MRISVEQNQRKLGSSTWELGKECPRQREQLVEKPLSGVLEEEGDERGNRRSDHARACGPVYRV